MACRLQNLCSTMKLKLLCAQIATKYIQFKGNSDAIVTSSWTFVVDLRRGPHPRPSKINPKMSFVRAPLQWTRSQVLFAEGILTFGGRKQCNEWFTTLHQGCDILHNDSRPCHRHLSGCASTIKLLLTWLVISELFLQSHGQNSVPHLSRHAILTKTQVGPKGVRDSTGPHSELRFLTAAALSTIRWKNWSDRIFSSASVL